MEGLDQEIAILRLKLKSLLANSPESVPLILQACRTLARLLVIKYQLPTSKKKDILDAATHVLRDIGIPLGITAAKKAVEDSL